MYTAPLPPGSNPIAVKYIVSYHIYHIIYITLYHISCHVISGHIISYIMSCLVISYHRISYHMITEVLTYTDNYISYYYLVKQIFLSTKFVEQMIVSDWL